MVQPLVFLDVDGTLLPIGGAPATGEGDAWEGHSNPLLGRLTKDHGPRLLALRCELMWATSWMHDANEEIAPRLGLPPLPVVDLDDVSREDGSDSGLFWKTRTLVQVAAGRPFVWIDDEITPADQDWIAAHHLGPALAYCVDARLGLVETDLAAIERWLGALIDRGTPGPA